MVWVVKEVFGGNVWRELEKIYWDRALKRGGVLTPEINTFSASNLPWRRRLVQLLQQSDRLIGGERCYVDSSTCLKYPCPALSSWAKVMEFMSDIYSHTLAPKKVAIQVYNVYVYRTL